MIPIAFFFLIPLVNPGHYLSPAPDPANFGQLEIVPIQVERRSPLLPKLEPVRTFTPSSTQRIKADLVEWNSCRDQRGKIAFEQLLVYQWSDYHRRFQLRSTFVLSDQQPQVRSQPVDGSIRIQWRDAGETRQLITTSFRRTTTDSDPEIAERRFLPRDRR